MWLAQITALATTTGAGVLSAVVATLQNALRRFEDCADVVEVALQKAWAIAECSHSHGSGSPPPVELILGLHIDLASALTVHGAVENIVCHGLRFLHIAVHNAGVCESLMNCVDPVVAGLLRHGSTCAGVAAAGEGFLYSLARVPGTRAQLRARADLGTIRGKITEVAAQYGWPNDQGFRELLNNLS